MKMLMSNLQVIADALMRWTCPPHPVC